MVKGRRAADRRREREQAEGVEVDPTGSTQVGDPYAARADTALGTGIGAGPKQQPIGDDLAGDTARLGQVAEVTAVREVEPPPKKRGARLKVRAGPDAGLDLVLAQTPAVVGRGRDADVKLSDPTISRAHLELRLVQEDDAWVVTDLGSSSGVLLCGAPLQGPAELKHGDLLALGQTELRFLWATAVPEEKPAPPKEPTRTGFRFTRTAVVKEPTLVTQTMQQPSGSPPGRRSLVAVALAAALLLVGGGGAAAWLLLRDPVDAGQKSAQVESLLADAQRLMDEGRLDEAEARLQTTLALAPDEPVAASLLRMIESEAGAQAALDEARELMAEGKVEEALARLGRIPDSSRLARAREEVRAEADERARKASLRVVERAVAEKDFDGALALLAPHRERWPRDAFARALEERVRKIQGAPPPDPPAVAKARDAFQQGRLMEARLLVEPEAAKGGAFKRYLQDLDTFEAALAEGTRLWRAKQRGAKDELEKAWRLLPRLGRNDKGAVAKDVRRPLADALYLDAMAAKARGDDCAWAGGVRRAATFAPRDGKIGKQQRAAKQAADAALDRARARAPSDKDAARSLAEGGLCYAAPGSATHKALRALAR